MRVPRLSVAALAILVGYGQASGAQVSPSGAEEIQRNLTRFIPADLVKAGLLTVQAATSVYELRFDPAPLLARTDAEKVTLSGVKPMVGYVKPLDSGLYEFRSDQNIDIKGHVAAGADSVSFSYLIDTLKMEGIFDPGISYFQSANWSAHGARLTSRTDKQVVEAEFGYIAMNLASVKASPDTLDITTSGLFKAFSENITDPQTGRVQIAADAVSIDVSLEGARHRAFRDLVYFLLGNMSKNALGPSEADSLKEILRASLPGFDNLLETITANNVSVETPQGDFGARKIAYTLDMNGISKSTRFGFGVTVEEPRPPETLPPNFLPAVPRTADVKLAITDLDLEGAARYLLDNADFTVGKPLSDEQNKALGNIILPDGSMTVELENVSAVSEIYDVSLTGRIKIYPEQQGRQNVDVTIVARDFDKTIGFLQTNAAVVPQFGQAAFMLLMIKGIAKDQGDGSQQWDVVVGEDGKVLVNGNPLPF